MLGRLPEAQRRVPRDVRGVSGIRESAHGRSGAGSETEVGRVEDNMEAEAEIRR